MENVSRDKQFFDMLSLIYCNYELGMYDDMDHMALDVHKLLINYLDNKSLFKGFLI